MRNLNLNVTTEEIAKIVNEEKSRKSKDQNYDPEINLALITDKEEFKLIELQNIQEFYVKNQKECEEFERKVGKMLDEYNIEYRDIFEGDYRCFYKGWIEDEGQTFDDVWDMMKTVIQEYKYPSITYQFLYLLFDFQYI